MLTEVKAYSSWRSAPTLPLTDGGRAETDLLQIRNIDGLDPVKASVNTSPFGAVDGASYTGSSVLTRNIVLTIGLKPDWDVWTFEKLRRLVYQYFMPKRQTRLVFYSDDLVPVEISGVVESCEVNQFSKDPEMQVSIICPDPYFTALEPVVLTGQTVPIGSVQPVEQSLPVTLIEYNGTIEAGLHLDVTATTDPPPTEIGIQLGDPKISYFGVQAAVNPSMYFELSSLPMQKFVQNINIGSGVITNLLSKVNIQEGALWPSLAPGENEFIVTTDVGVHDWELTYYERFGGL